jgi:hypothetical protein
VFARKEQYKNLKVENAFDEILTNIGTRIHII